MSRRHRVMAAAAVLVLLAGAGVLIFGPMRGARDDIGHVRTDLHASRAGIYGTLGVGRRSLARVSAQLRLTEDSLRVQRSTLRTARSTSGDTRRILRQTSAVLRAAQQALRSGRSTLSVVLAGLRTLRQSRAIQHSLLVVARKTLEQTREINRKTP